MPSNDLIVACAALLMLSACCTEDTQGDCTQEQIAKYNADEKPHLITEQDGVRLYWVKPCWDCRVVHFTTPCGDVHWTTEERHGKTTETLDHYTQGAGCK